MGAKAGEFFVNLGLKGDSDTQNKLEKQVDTWKDVKSASTEAKLAILAVLYGVERMVSTYGAAGQALQNFNTLTGISFQTLQAYENQAQKAGAANGELTQTFDTLQKQMFTVMSGGQVPPWLNTIIGTLQGTGVKFSGEEQTNTAQAWGAHPELMFQRIRQFAQNKALDQWKTFNVLREMGIPDNIIAGMRQGFFDPGNLAAGASQALSDQTVKNLTTLNREWVDMTLNFKKFAATLVGSDLTGIVRDLSAIATQTYRIVNALDQLGHKVGVFKAIHLALGNVGELSKMLADVSGNTVLPANHRPWKDVIFGTFHQPPATVHHHHVHGTVHNHFAPGSEKSQGKVRHETSQAMKDIVNLYSAKVSR